MEKITEAEARLWACPICGCNSAMQVGQGDVGWQRCHQCNHDYPLPGTRFDPDHSCACVDCTADRLMSRWHHRWLKATRELQVDAYHDENWPKEGEALAESVMMNAFAAIKEISEATDEVGWKPWDSKRGWVNREAFIAELVDVGHFLANMLIAVGCTDDEWDQRYREKMKINLVRQLRGYNVRSEKCPGCKRSYDDPTTSCHLQPNGSWVCNAALDRESL